MLMLISHCYETKIATQGLLFAMAVLLTLMKKENGLHNQHAVPVSQQKGLLLGTSSVRPLETCQAYTNSRYAPLTESISNTQVLTSLLLLIRVRKISCAPRATFCRSVIPLQAPKNLRAVEIHTIGSSFIYSCRKAWRAFQVHSSAEGMRWPRMPQPQDARDTACCPVSNPGK